jgi:hypothetical protein
VTGIDFVDLESHLSRFKTELTDHERT